MKNTVEQASIMWLVNNAESNFYSSLMKLGFRDICLNDGSLVKKEQQAEALFKIFYMAGYLNPKALWQDINHIPSIKNKEQVFISLAKAIARAKGYQNDYNKYNSKLLVEELAKVPLSDDNWEDFLLYVSQHAFNRKVNQERNELIRQDWMELYKEEYIKEAKLLGLIERKNPMDVVHEEAWIAGASRVGILARLHDHKYYLYLAPKLVKLVNSYALILAGQRELWANIDGLSPEVKELLETMNLINMDQIEILVPAGDDKDTILEGKEYMLNLARERGIKLNAEQPFIEKAGGRIYANYAEGESKKLTESVMAQDILDKYFFSMPQVNIVDTEAKGTDTRPNTCSTALDAVKDFIDRVLQKNLTQKEYYILYQSNNPYIERQALATQLAVNKALKQQGLDKLGYKIIIDGVGFCWKQDVVTIHSELAALISEKWKFAHQDWPDNGTTQIMKDLMFQTRDSSYFNEPMPEVNMELLGDQ